MSSLYGRWGIFPASRLFIKVDTVGVSMYNRGLEAMPMEFWLCFFGLIGVIVGVLESIRGDIER